MFVDSSLARGLAKKHLTEWGAQGILLRNKFERIIGNARFRLGGGASPSKCVNKALSDLRILFAQSPGAGSIVETHGRRSEFSLICPAPTDEGLAFSVLAGYLNGRTGGLDLKVSRPLVISIHALERLHQRIGVVDPTDVLSEIYGVVCKCSAVLQAAKQVGAQSCPLLSKRGIFVTAPTSDTLTSALITWMPFDQLSRKWGAVADNLREVANHRPELLHDHEFLVKFLRSNPWMLNPHRPGPDFEALAWRQNCIGGEVSTEPSLPFASEDYVRKIEADLALPLELVSHLPEEVRSIDLIPGHNYSQEPPPFKVYDRMDGMVVQISRSGYVIVSLLNGWFGSIPPIGLERANHISDGLGDLRIGDKVSVDVTKTRRSDPDNAWTISLDLAEKVDAEWSHAAVRHPKGTMAEGKVFRVLDHCCYLRLNDGVVAVLFNKERFWSLGPTTEENTLTPGQVLKLTVIDLDQKKKRLVVSSRGATDSSQIEFARQMAPGTKLEGRVIKVTNYGVHVRLPGGIDGLMHGENNRGAGHLKIGDAVNVEVLQIDNERRRISLAFSMAGAELREFFAAVEATQEEWERTLVAHPTGSLVEGQVSRLFVAGTSIVLADGASGYLPDKELSWTTKGTVVKETLKVGQFVKLVVIGFKTAKRRLTFSQRKCTAQPWDDPDLRPVVGQEYKGVVSNVVDYGAFIKLPTGLEGLLHMSALPEGWKYETGQAVTVVVTSIEDERQRISLGLGVPRTQMGEDTHTLVS